MKCPYRNFEECTVEQCPSCNYEEVKEEITSGIYPHYMSTEKALEEGYAWKETKTTYKFLSCKLVENNVQPIPSDKKIIHNHNEQKTVVSVRRSIF